MYKIPLQRTGVRLSRLECGVFPPEDHMDVTLIQRGVTATKVIKLLVMARHVEQVRFYLNVLLYANTIGGGTVVNYGEGYRIN